MAQRFHPDADLRAELLRLARAQFRAVAAELRRTAARPAGPVADRSRARAKIKKLRALLALGRDGCGGAFFRREAAWLRRLARLLAPARDAEARVESLRRLRRRAAPAAAAALDRLLLAAASPDPQPPLDLDALAGAFERRSAFWPRACSRKLKLRHLRHRSAQTRERARRALRAALEQPSAEALHRLRRRAKFYGLQLEYLGPLAPRRSPDPRRLASLAKDLGEEHDLELLLAWLPAGVPLAALSGAEEAAVRRPLMRRRDLLRARSLRAGRRLLGPAG